MKSLETVKSYINPLFTRDYWQMIAEYIGLGRKKKLNRIVDLDTLSELLASRASHVAQSSLYGYLRTRAGTRFPTLFENPDLLKSINIAKWHVWLACLSDVSIFVGQCLYQSGEFDQESIDALIPAALAKVIEETGEPDEAGPDFVAGREKVVQRIQSCDWQLERDDDTVFSQSPEALFYWSPIADELKERDEEIVKNSVRYRWIEVRRNIRTQLDYGALRASLVQADA